MTLLGKHFSLAELTRTGANVPNVASPAQIQNLRDLVKNVLDPLREAMGSPIRVTSGYRSPALNKAVGGSITSDHLSGRAADLNNKGGKTTNKELYTYIKDNLPFDQLIWENGTDFEPDWVHVSFRASGNRKEVLRKHHNKPGYDRTN